MSPRRRTKDLDLPPRMRRKGKALYYDHGYDPAGRRYWEPLGSSLPEAKLKWGRIEAERKEPTRGDTVAGMLHYYRVKHLSSLAERTQKDRSAHLDVLEKAFGHMRPDAVKPQHVAQFLEAHKAPVSANRQIATLSVAYAKGMRVGMATRNPCIGVERNKETGRDRYITDAEFLAVKALADEHGQAVMDLAYATGSRLGDLIRLTHSQIEDDGLVMRQGKTGQRQVMELTPELAGVIRRLKASRKVQGMTLIRSRRGQPYTANGFKAWWQRLQRKAIREGVIAERFTFHDIRAKSATDADDQGHDPQALLGHTTRKQTETYLRSRKSIRVQPLKPRKSQNG
ncbi:MAG: tyrosine-type recombinase/integrase [Xanthomonadales bacterium]|nr:tyrosine-type recombinase/integrase [Xanthomonadales bacterium]